MKINITLEYIMREIEKEGVDPAVFRQRLFVGHLEAGEEKLDSALIYSLTFIQDGRLAIMGSSNISDRGLMNQNNELGFLIADEGQVSNLQRLLCQQHTMIDDINSFEDFFQLCHEESGLIRKHRLCTNKKQLKQFKTLDSTLRIFIGDNKFE